MAELENKWLEKTTISVLKEVDIITVPSTATAASALRILTKHNILCAPILEESSNTYIGLIDMLDLVTFIVDIYKDLEGKGEATDFFSVLESGERFVTQDVKTIADFSQRNPFLPVRSDASLMSVLKLFGELCIRRLPVVNEAGKVVNLITQSAIVEYIAQHASHFPHKMNQTVGELLIGCKPVVSVNIENKAIDAFKLMAERKVSAVAVVDDDKHLIANISARDIRKIAQDEKIIHALFTPIRQFVQLLFSDRYEMEMNPGISCTVKDTLGTVFQKLTVSRVHRVYVVDPKRQVMGVIALSDAILGLVIAAPSTTSQTATHS